MAYSDNSDRLQQQHGNNIYQRTGKVVFRNQTQSFGPRCCAACLFVVLEIVAGQSNYGCGYLSERAGSFPQD